MLNQDFKITDIGPIPQDWEVKTIGELCKVFGRIGFRGYTVQDIVPAGKGAIALSPSNIIDNQLKLEKVTYISWFKYEESPEIKVYNGDILLVKTASIGKTAFVSELKESATVNPQIVVLKQFKCSGKFLSYILKSPIVQNKITTTAVGGVIPTLSQEQINKFPIPLPPLAEQNAIAAALSDMDALIAQTDTLIAKKKAIKQGLMQELLSPKADWVTKKLGEVLQYEQPTKYIVLSDKYHPHSPIPVLTAGKSFILGYTNETDNVFENLPVIIFDDFTTASQYVDFKFKVKSSAMKILKRKNPNINLRFMYEVLQNIKYQVGDHKRHWIGEFQHFEIQLPEYEEMNRIGQIMEDFQSEIELLETKLQKLKLQKQGMMQALLTGKIRLTER